MIQQLNDKLQKKSENVNPQRPKNPSEMTPPRTGKNYMPSRFNVNERVPPITYSSKVVLNDLENKVESLDDNLVNIEEGKFSKKVAESKTILPMVSKITVPNEFKKKPLRRHENDFLLYKEIFVQPKEKVLIELKEKEKNFENLFYEGASKQYDKILNIYDEENEKQKEKMLKTKKDLKKTKEDANKLILKSKSEYYEKNGKDSSNMMTVEDKNKSTVLKNDSVVIAQEIGTQDKKNIERNFFDQQIQVQPPEMPNATIASPLTPGNGWAPSIPLTHNLKEGKINIKDLLVRAKAGMQAGDIQKEAHLSFYLGIVHENNKAFKEAIKYYKKYFSCAKLMEDKIGMALATNRIGVNYFNQKRYDKSVEFHLQNISLSDIENAFAGYYNLGIAYRKLKEYDQAMENFQKSLEWSQQKEELESECLATGQIGVTYIELNCFNEALEDLSKCYELSKKIKNIKLQLDCLMFITKITGMNITEENYENTINILKDALEYQDSSVVFKNGEIVESDLQTSKEIFDLFKNLKKYNPRIVNYALEKNWKDRESKKPDTSNPEEFFPAVVSLNDLAKNLKNRENETQLLKNAADKKNNKRLNLNATVYSNDKSGQFSPNYAAMLCEPNFAPNPFILGGYQNEDKNEKFTKSKNIQNQYETGDFFKKNEIFQFSILHMHELILDTYYNYIIQKILEIGLPEHKSELFQLIKLRFLDYSYQKYGCRVIQKTLEAFQDRLSYEYKFMLEIIKSQISELFFHENGNFVIQKCLEIYQGEDFYFLLNQIHYHLIALCQHKYGCLIIQKLSEIYKDKDATLKARINEVLLKILSMSFDLSKKEYSNYIIQHILEAGHLDHKNKLLYNYIKPNFILLSCDQFASNVSEKAIIFSDKEFRKAIWKGLKDFKNLNESLLKLVNDKYGNYVMQRVYEYSESDIQAEFETILEQYSSSLNSQGQFVMKFIQKLKFK